MVKELVPSVLSLCDDIYIRTLINLDMLHAHKLYNLNLKKIQHGRSQCTLLLILIRYYRRDDLLLKLPLLRNISSSIYREIIYTGLICATGTV